MLSRAMKEMMYQKLYQKPVHRQAVLDTKMEMTRETANSVQPIKKLVIEV